MGASAPLVRAVDLKAGVLAALAAAYPQRYPVLFDSAASGPLAQASILAAFPTATLSRRSDGGVAGAVPESGFLDALDAQWQAEREPELPRDHPHGGLPFRGGWVVYLGYEIAAEVEPRLRLPHAAHDIEAFAWRVPMAIVSEADGAAWLVAEAGTPDNQVRQLLHDLQTTEPPAASGLVPAARIEEEDPERFLARVRAAQEYIRAGDIYQANLSRPWRVELNAGTSVHELYRRLRIANPAPFAALAHIGDKAILSSSPERLLRIEHGRIDTRPIAGTYPRGSTAEEDLLLAANLLAHPKERAEHVMLIDLERNDLGRVCQPGTVQVDEYMAVETYAHVHHIVSNVRGRLRADVSPVAALRAVFPGGTITGCPKFRCMQIIAEQEAEPRGAYTGSLGYINRDGSADFNILIRTMTLENGRIEFRAGAGIVADSNAGRELQETRAKARGLLMALT